MSLSFWNYQKSVPVSALVLLAGCSDIETAPVMGSAEADVGVVNPQPDTTTDGSGGDEVPAVWSLPTDRFVQQRWAPGSDWYDYDSATHVLTPKARVYSVDRGQGVHQLRILSYYDRRGESGTFTLQVRGPSGSVSELRMTSNIKQGSVCLSLGSMSEVPCDGDADLIARTDFRPVPAAGFSVANPSLYGRRTPSGEGAVLGMAERVDFAPDGAEIPTIDTSDILGLALWEYLAEGRVANVLQLTGSLHVLQWVMRLNDADGDGQGTLEVDSRCVRAAAAEVDQQPLPELLQPRLELELTNESAQTLFLSFCTEDGPVVREQWDRVIDGDWPDTRTWDLALERAGRSWRVIPAAGALLAGVADEQAAVPAEIPWTLWDL